MTEALPSMCQDSFGGDIEGNVAGRCIRYKHQPPHKKKQSESPQEVALPLHQGLVDISNICETTSTTSLKRIADLLQEFKKICEDDEFPEFNIFLPEFVNITDAISLLLAFVTREILRNPPDNRKEDFTESKLLDALIKLNHFQNHPSGFYTSIKDLLPADVRGVNTRRLVRISILIASVGDFHKALQFITLSQLSDYTRLFEAFEADPSQEMDHHIDRVHDFITTSERIPQVRGCPDMKAYLRFASQITIDLQRHLSKIHAVHEQSLYKKLDSLSAKLPTIRMSIKLPRRIRVLTATVASLLSRSDTWLRIMPNRPPSEVTILVRELNSLQAKRVLARQQRHQLLLGTIDYLSIASGTPTQANQKRSCEYINQLLHIHVSTVHKEMYQVICDVLCIQFPKDKPIKQRDLEGVQRGVIGHLLKTICTKAIQKKAPVVAYIKAAEKTSLETAQIKALTDAFKLSVHKGHAAHLDYLSCGCSYLHENLAQTTTEKDHGDVVRTLLILELTYNVHQGDVTFLLEALARRNESATPNNIRRVVNSQIRLKITGSNGLGSTSDPLCDDLRKLLLLRYKEALLATGIGKSLLLAANIEVRNELLEIQRVCQLMVKAEEPMTLQARHLLGGLVDDADLHLLEKLLPENEYPSSQELEAERQEREAIAEISFQEIIAQEENLNETATEERDITFDDNLGAARSSTLVCADADVVCAAAIEFDLPEGQVSALITKTPLSPPPQFFVALSPPEPRTLLGKKRLSSISICEVQSQIAFHQALTLLATLIQDPTKIIPLAPTLMEALHLTLEQQLTAIGLRDKVVIPGTLLDHKLCTRARECGRPELIGKMQIVGNTGTYNARYPSMNKVSITKSSFIAQILQAAETGTIEHALVLNIATHLNLVMADLTKTKVIKEKEVATALKPFAIKAEPLKFDPKGYNLLYTGIVERFPADSKEKEDLLLHTQELDNLITMIGKDGGIRKELSGIILHAVHRIRQYTTKNLMTLLVREQGEVENSEIPVRHRDLVKQLNLTRTEEEEIVECDMKKGLDYPLGMRGQRSLTRNETALVAAHHLSLSPPGFVQTVKGTTEEETAQEISQVVESTIHLLTLLLKLQLEP